MNLRFTYCDLTINGTLILKRQLVYLGKVLCSNPVAVLWKGREQPGIDNWFTEQYYFCSSSLCLLRTGVKSGDSILPNLKCLRKLFARLELTGKIQSFAVAAFKTWLQSYFENAF